MSEQNRGALLRRIPLCAALPEAAMAELEDRIEERRYLAGQPIFAQGDVGRELLIIGQGSVKIFQSGAGAEVVLAILGEGDVFGEMSLLDGKPRGASAVALRDTTLLALTQEHFNLALRHEPEAISYVLCVLSERLREAGARLSEAASFDLRERLAQRLWELAERDADETDAGRRIRTPLSDADLARRAGGTVERVRSEMDRLRREMIVTASDGIVTVLKPGDLRDLAAGGGGGAGSITLPDWLLG